MKILNSSRVHHCITFSFGYGFGFILSALISWNFVHLNSQRKQEFDSIDKVIEANLIELRQPINNSMFHSNNDTESSPYFPRVLCYLLVGPSTHSKAIHIKDTWGTRCDSVLFFSTKKDSKLNPVVLDVEEGYSYLWSKSKAALLYIFKNHFDFDWYLKADDDTYVIVENLKFFLKDLSPSEAVYHGVKFKQFVKQGYMSGGGGYVMSQEALKRFVTVSMNITDEEKCEVQSETGAEDLQLGKCLEASGVKAGNSLDSNGLPRFFSHAPTALFFRAPLINRFHWYWRYIWHQHILGLECCSRHMISFHDVDPRMMWTLEALLYRLQIHREFSKI